MPPKRPRWAVYYDKPTEEKLDEIIKAMQGGGDVITVNHAFRALIDEKYAVIKGSNNPLVRTYYVSYVAVCNDTGHHGTGEVQATDLKTAHTYAMELILKACPECQGYTQHKLVVSTDKSASLP